MVNSNDPKSLAEERKRLEEYIEKDCAADFTTGFFHYNCLDYFSNKQDELIVNKIFHYEDFENEIEMFFNEMNLSKAEIPVVNETHKKNYRDYYTDKSCDLIAQKCDKDIQFFNYKF